MRHVPPRRRADGVSLIEALVALAVLGFGMLAVAGVQGTLRLNSDISKQRGEAVRIGQEAIETWRSFAQLPVDPDGKLRAYDDIASAPASDVAGYTTNTTYRIERQVTDAAGSPHKSMRVIVRWTDRNGAPQSITLDTLAARTDPALTAVALTGSNSPVAAPSLGRHAAIPREAKDMGGGLSAFKPPVPGSGDGTAGTVVWVFNNLTGMIQGICNVPSGLATASLTAANIAGCKDNGSAHPLSGYVRFATENTQPTAAVAEAPGSTARNLDIELTLTDGRTGTCFDDAPTTATAAATTTHVRYFCAIPANDTKTWDGYSTIVPQPFTEPVDSAWAIPAKSLPPKTTVTHQLCRYTPAASDAQAVANADHPYIYRTVYADPPRNRQPLAMPPLTNQNFLVILAGFNCPTDVPADPGKGDFVNSNTLVHKPLP